MGDFAIAARAQVAQAVDSVRTSAVLRQLPQIRAPAPHLANHAMVAIAADPSRSRVPIGLSFARMPLTASLDFAIAARAQVAQAVDSEDFCRSETVAADSCPC